MNQLTRVQLNKAINNKIASVFSAIPILSRDIQEGFDRPSFFVSIETNQTETYQFQRQRDMTCRILFFPTDRYEYKEETYDVQDRLEELFGLNFVVRDRVITIGSANTDVIDKVLHYNFDFSYFDEVPQGSQGEPMRELQYNE